MTGDSADSGCWDITSVYWLTNSMLNGDGNPLSVEVLIIFTGTSAWQR